MSLGNQCDTFTRRSLYLVTHWVPSNLGCSVVLKLIYCFLSFIAFPVTFTRPAGFLVPAVVPASLIAQVLPSAGYVNVCINSSSACLASAPCLCLCLYKVCCCFPAGLAVSYSLQVGISFPVSGLTMKFNVSFISLFSFQTQTKSWSEYLDLVHVNRNTHFFLHQAHVGLNFDFCSLLLRVWWFYAYHGGFHTVL